MSDEPTPEPRIQAQLPTGPFNGLCIIGESPGQEEIEQGYPFVGRSGKLLDTVLQEVGIDRSCCLVTNVFFSRPPNNKIDAFFRMPNAEEDADFIARWGSLP